MQMTEVTVVEARMLCVTDLKGRTALIYETWLMSLIYNYYSVLFC